MSSGGKCSTVTNLLLILPLFVFLAKYIGLLVFYFRLYNVVLEKIKEKKSIRTWLNLEDTAG